MEVGGAGLRQLPEGGEEFAQAGDGPFEGDAEARLGQEFGAERQSEMVATVRGRLGGLRLAGDQQRVAAEDGNRGRPHVQAGHFAPDDRRELG